MPRTTTEPEPTTEPAPEPEPDDGEPAWKGSASATEPQIAPDGHVVLSQEDIDARH
jgi:hypothetical protein